MQVSRWTLENMWCIISCLGPLSHEDAGLCWEGEQRLASLVGHKVLDGAPSLWIWNLRRLCHGLIGKTNSVSYRLLAASSASFLQGGIGGQQNHPMVTINSLTCVIILSMLLPFVIHDCMSSTSTNEWPIQKKKIAYNAPIATNMYPLYGVTTLAIGLVLSGTFFVTQMSSNTKNVQLELALGSAASVTLGISTLFIMLSFGLYVWITCWRLGN